MNFIEYPSDEEIAFRMLESVIFKGLRKGTRGSPRKRVHTILRRREATRNGGTETPYLVRRAINIFSLRYTSAERAQTTMNK